MAVRGLGTQLFHELLAAVHSVLRLRLVRLGGEEARDHLVS